MFAVCFLPLTQPPWGVWTQPSSSALAWLCLTHWARAQRGVWEGAHHLLGGIRSWFQRPGANHHPPDTRGHKTHPVSLCSWVWGSGIQAGLSDPGHPLGCLGWCGLLPSMVAAGHCPSPQGPGTSAGVHGQAQDAQPLGAAQAPGKAEGPLWGVTPTLLHRTDVSLTPWCRTCRGNGGCGRPQTFQLRPSLQPGESMSSWSSPHACSHGGPPAPPQAPVRSRASGLGVRNAPGPRWSREAAWGRSCQERPPPPPPGPLSTATRMPACASLGWNGRTTLFSSGLVPGCPLPSRWAGWLWNAPGQLRLHGGQQRWCRPCRALSLSGGHAPGPAPNAAGGAGRVPCSSCRPPG